MTAIGAWRSWTAGQIIVRAVVAVLPLLALLLAPARAPLPMVLLVVVTSLVWAVRPDSPAGPLVLLAVMAWWALKAGDTVPVNALAAALALAAAHVAGLLAAYAPMRAALDQRLVVRWGRRLLLGSLLAPLAYAAVTGLDGAIDLATDVSLWPWAMAVLGLLCLVVGMQLRDGSAADPN